VRRADLVHALLLDAAERRPAAPAILHRDASATFEEIARDARGLAAWLRGRGLNPGDRVAVLQPDPVAYATSYFGALIAGGVAVPLHPQATSRGLATVLRDCTPAFVAAGARVLPALAGAAAGGPGVRVVLAGGLPAKCPPPGLELHPLEEACATTPRADAATDPADPALILYTSGTTGEPKGAVLSHGALVANTRSVVQYLRLGPQDRVLHVLPFSYSYGNSVLLTHLAAGGSVVVDSFAFPGVTLRLLAQQGVTGFSGVPTTFAILLEHLRGEHAFPSLRYLTSAGGPITRALVHRILATFPGVELFLMYGQTEASSRLSYLPPPLAARLAGSIGRAIPGVQLELLDPDGRPPLPGDTGEIVATGPNLMSGYWGRPDLTAQVLRDGRLWTGDLARRDEEGWLWIVGRKSDMVKSAGHRIAPREIEEALLLHPGVRDAGVAGVPDPIAGEALEAWVVPQDAAAPGEKELVHHCRALLPPFKVPRRIRFRDALPRTASGKLRRAELREEARREREDGL
jgi:acyl-CoA synthetase (AMP-forming)/AMP-acid ligase II